MGNLFNRPVALSIGPLRCGTSWMHNYLKSREDICLPEGVKEIFYFDRHFQRGREFYASHFLLKPDHKLVMELTTTAFDNPDAPSHVHKLLGSDVRLICPLRHPVDRTKAVYADYIKYGLIRGGIEEAVENSPQLLFSSRYAEHLDRWFIQFDRKNIHLLYYEVLEHNPNRFAQELCQALNIPFLPPRNEGWMAKAKRLFQKPSLPEMSQADELWLRNRLLPEITRLEKLIGHPINYWK